MGEQEPQPRPRAAEVPDDEDAIDINLEEKSAADILDELGFDDDDEDLEGNLNISTGNKVVPFFRRGKINGLKLTKRERTILARHIEGTSTGAIANEIGCSVYTILQFLRSTRAESAMQVAMDELDLEINSLLRKSLMGLRNDLGQRSSRIRHAAIDRIVKIADLRQKQTGGNTNSVQVNIIQEVREKFVGGLKEAAERSKVIDVDTSEPVPSSED